MAQKRACVVAGTTSVGAVGRGAPGRSPQTTERAPTRRMDGIARRTVPSRVNPQVWISASLATHSSYRNPNCPSRKMFNNYSVLRLPAKSPKVNRFREYGPGPERKYFGCIGMGVVGRPAATTLQNNGNFQPCDEAENGFCVEFGGATGTGIRHSPPVTT